MYTPGLLGPEALNAAPDWLWIPIAISILAWILVCPLVMARRRIGLPAFPVLRRFIVEGLHALAFAPVVLAMVVAVGQIMAWSFGAAVQSANPLEPVVTSSDRFHSHMLIGLAILAAPIAEEMFFRGVLFNLLKQRFRPALAAILQGLVFGFLHPFSLSDRAMIATGGIGFALYYQRRRTLLAPIYLHSLLNIASIGFMLWLSASYANAPVLGVRVEAVDQGCVITLLVPGGAAEEAGLRVGDVITGVGDYSVADQRDIVLVLRTKQVGDKTHVYFRRGDEDYLVEATLQARAK